MQEKLEKVGSSRTQSIKHKSILITFLHSSDLTLNTDKDLFLI